MTSGELTIALNAMGVTVIDLNRAALYYDYLVEVQNYFAVTLQNPLGGGGLGAGYNFVAPAINANNLLTQLAEILDLRVAPAVDGDMRWEFTHGHAGWTYDDYFNNMIFNANPVTFGNNVANFRARYPISGHALRQLTDNFKANILISCRRIYADRALLRDFYNDLYNDALQILSLTRISSSGSDFHKGGSQVLILTFSVRYTQLMITYNTELKVVYKPSDLEADCLLTGSSFAVNNVIPGFMDNSLVEIYNEIIDDHGMDALELPTYRILPRNYNSLHGAGLPLPIRDAYGYIEYLNNDLVWGNSERWGYYRNATSDYVIFKSEAVLTLIYRFYLTAGAFTAISSTFSNIDLHIENVRVTGRIPHLIDMEISLVTAVNDMGETSLYGGHGGITGVHVNTQDYEWGVQHRNTPGAAQLIQVYKDEYYANRLYRALPGRQTEMVEVSAESTIEGFHEAMNVLRVGQENSAFDNWFARLNNVVVRVLPFRTPDFKHVFNRIINDKQMTVAGRGAAFQATLDTELLARRTQFFAAYQDAAIPEFLAFLDVQSGPDYLSMDIPVFYYRIGNNSSDIVNSRGQQVAIPAQIQVYDDQDPPQPHMVPCAARVQRNTYYPDVPTTDVVRTPQVNVLGGGGFQARYDVLMNSLLETFGLDAIPDELHDIINND